MAQTSLAILGGHAMAVVAYDETRQAVRVLNSWGQDWGDGGYAWINYDTFRERMNEAWTIRDPAPTPQPTPKPEPPPLRPEPKPEPLWPVAMLRIWGSNAQRL